MSENKSRTFFQYPVAESTEIVDEIPTAWRHGTCSPVNGWAAVELMLELTDDKPLQNHFRPPGCHAQNMLSNLEQIYHDSAKMRASKDLSMTLSDPLVSSYARR